MGLIWIKETNPREKLYLEELGLHAETLEELSYLILKYPPLFLDNFVGEKFFSFLSRGARHSELARELRSLQREKAKSDEILSRFLARGGYASPRQQSLFAQSVKEYLAFPKERAEQKKGDLFLSLRKYGKAVAAYERALAKESLDRATKSTLLDREGAALANLFLT